jgi:hypothetical protein
MTSGRTIAERGAETVKRYVNGETKAGFTFFASILVDGPKLPLSLLAKGKTPRCHRRFGLHPPYEHLIWHSSNGWCNSCLMEAYLHWLRGRLTAARIVLLMDRFGAHETLEIYYLAEALTIHLIFIPCGGTGQYHPLDRRTFGALTAMGRSRWTALYARNPGVMCTRELAAGLLLGCWDALSQCCVQDGWDLGAEAQEETSSSDDGDAEWQLTMEQYPEGSEDESDDDEEETLSDGCELVEDVEARYGYAVT